MKMPPYRINPNKVWDAVRSMNPEAVEPRRGNLIVDLIPLARHVLDPSTPLLSFETEVAKRYRNWLDDQASGGSKFSASQLEWLNEIRTTLTMRLAINLEDLDTGRFRKLGGLARARELFGENLARLLKELAVRLTA
jgi:type I restriction enzyme R subunit